MSQTPKQREWYLKNRERILAEAKERHGLNKEKQNLKCRLYSLNNKEKIKQKGLEYRKKNKEKIREQILYRNYGICVEDYNLLLNNQNGVCAICKTSTKLSVDHIHTLEFKSLDAHEKRKTVRGLLCVKCNHAIGYFKDSKEILLSAQDYLLNALLTPNIRFCSQFRKKEPEIYKGMLIKCNSLCQICRSAGSGTSQYDFLCVDHDHKTKAVRGLLCCLCNAGLGHFNEDLKLFLQAIEYLAQPLPFMKNAMSQRSN